MSAIITNKFRVHNAEQFYESFSEAVPTTYYLWIGRPQAFSSATGGGTDSAPPTPSDTVGDEFRYFRDMIGAKKITSSDVSYVIPRRNWTAGVTYDVYNHDYTTLNTANSGATNLWDSTFYVMNSNYRVYKVIDNNGNSAVDSAAMPDSTNTSGEFSTTDQYVWKYMFTMTTSMVQNFLSTDFMPISASATDAAAVATNAVNGEVRHFQIVSGGAGYNNSSGDGWPTGTAGHALKGDGTGGQFKVKVSSGVITEVNIVAAGTNYTFANLDLANVTGLGTASTDAVINPLIGPKGGHGKDPIKELGGFFVMMNTSIAGAEGSGDFVVDQDFRRVGLVRDPLNSLGTALVDTTASGLKYLIFSSSTGNFVVDEVISNVAGAKGVVADWDATTKNLKYIQTEYTGVDTTGNLDAFADADTITGATSSASGTVATSGVKVSEIKYHSGDIIYVENRAPIIRASDQTENIKLVIEF